MPTKTESDPTQREIDNLKRLFQGIVEAQEEHSAKVEVRLAEVEQDNQILHAILQAAQTDNNAWQVLLHAIGTLEPQWNGKGPLVKHVSQRCKREFRQY